MATKYRISPCGFIEATGTERNDFFNRMSTNDLKLFPELTYKKTVFTSDKGRIIDLSTLINEDGKTSLVGSPQYTLKLKEHLEKYIITDDVQLEIPANEYFRISIYSEQPEETALEVCEIDIKHPGQVFKISESVYSFIDDFRSKVLNIICRDSYLPVYRKKLLKYDYIEDDEYEYKRINNFVPEAESELNEEVNPVECGLSKYISYTKGCYIGQEVIARLDSQGKIPKQMVKLSTDVPVNSGSKIFLDGTKECGFVSSSVSFNNENLSLGFIRSVDLNNDNTYTVEKDGTHIETKIFPLEELSSLIK